MAKNLDSLPASTTAENIIKLIEIYKRKNNDKEAKPLFGMGDTAYSRTKSALKSFGIIQEKGCNFTTLGQDIAYSEADEKKEQLLNIIWGYSPYESLLNNIFSKGWVKDTDTTFITNYWGRFKFGSTLRNREDAANLFGNMVEFVGLGKFIKGHKTTASRIEWENNVAEMLNNVDTKAEIYKQEIPEESKRTDINFVEIKEELEDSQKQPEIEQVSVGMKRYNFPVSNIKAAITPNITINVDMSTWSDEQIKNFFKYAYAQFGEENK